jgi:hypothetical protein
VLRTGTTCELVQDVLEHRLEGAFVCGPVDHPELAAETLAFREDLAVLTSPSVRRPRPSSSAEGATSGSCASSCCGPAAPTASGWRRSWRGAASATCGCWNSARSRPSSAASRPGSASRCCRAAWFARSEREGRIAIHDLPRAEARVDTLFIRRRDAFVSSALTAFLDCACEVPAMAAE